MYGLGKRDEDRRNAQLVICEVLHNIGVKSKNAELVCTHDASQELHEQDFVIEREALVITVQVVIELLAECLRIIEQLDGRKIGRERVGFPILFLPDISYQADSFEEARLTDLKDLSVLRIFFSPLLVFLLISLRCFSPFTSGSCKPIQLESTRTIQVNLTSSSSSSESSFSSSLPRKKCNEAL